MKNRKPLPKEYAELLRARNCARLTLDSARAALCEAQYACQYGQKMLDCLDGVLNAMTSTADAPDGAPKPPDGAPDPPDGAPPAEVSQ